MRTISRWAVGFLGGFLAAGALSCGGGEERVFVSIGTGSLTGVYYPTGGYIAKMINEREEEYNIRCTVESTEGSVYNVNAILGGDFEFGIVQSDRQYQAWNGLAEWEQAGPQADLRSVFSLHSEAITLMAADDADIETVEDLEGKVVNIGNPGSGQRQNSIDVLESAGLDPETDLTAEGVKASEAPGLLQDERIDAFFFTVGHPSGAIMEATAGRRKVHFVPITDVEDLLEEFPYYARTVIEKKHYPQATNEADAPTIGVKATFMTSVDVPEDVVYAFTREVFDNLDEFKTLHPSLSQLTREGMLEGLTAPLHSGALRYYREAGLR